MKDDRSLVRPLSDVPSQSLARMGYRLDPDSNVWRPENYKGFAYSDGDEEEKYIFDAIRTARDVSC